MPNRARTGAKKSSAKDRIARFMLSSEDCELLLALETAESTDAAAKLLSKHASVVSRRLAELAERAPVLEKAQGRWRLTATGLRIAQWAREQAIAQASILAAPSRVRIATTREFGARIVSPALGELRTLLGVTCVELSAVEAGVERELLAGRADVGLTCGRAVDPAVAFRRAVDESYALLVPAGWSVRQLSEILGRPHVVYSRAPAGKLLGLERELENIVGLFNDIGAVREACVAGQGWCVLPRYAVAREIDAGQLRAIDDVTITADRFGVFWLRARTNALPWLEALFDWLSRRSL